MMSDKDIKPIEPGYWSAVKIGDGLVLQSGGILTCTGADYETVDDGSAAHEPEVVAPLGFLALLAEDRVRTMAEQIGALLCEQDQLRREIALVRELLSRMSDEDVPAADPVRADIERTIDHLLNGRTTKDQRRGLATATERAERVPAGADAAVGRALR